MEESTLTERETTSMADADEDEWNDDDSTDDDHDGFSSGFDSDDVMSDM